MSMTESESRSRSREGRTSVDERYQERVFRETKPSFATTEFWAMLVGVVPFEERVEKRRASGAAPARAEMVQEDVHRLPQHVVERLDQFLSHERIA